MEKPINELRFKDGTEIITPKVIKQRRVYIVREFFGGSIRRLLRTMYKQYKYQLVYSKGLKTLPEDVRIYLLKSNPWPVNICSTYNIYKTLVKKFGHKETVFTMELAKYIFEYFSEDIEDYIKQRYTKGVVNNGFKNNITAAQALKEQKARGFIHINKFGDYKRKYAHVYSTVDTDYVYPLNLWHSYRNRKHSDIMSYHGQHLVSVRGFTKIVLPKVK